MTPDSIKMHFRYWAHSLMLKFNSGLRQRTSANIFPMRQPDGFNSYTWDYHVIDKIIIIRFADVTQSLLWCNVTEYRVNMMIKPQSHQSSRSLYPHDINLFSWCYALGPAVSMQDKHVTVCKLPVHWLKVTNVRCWITKAQKNRMPIFSVGLERLPFLAPWLNAQFEKAL